MPRGPAVGPVLRDARPAHRSLAGPGRRDPLLDFDARGDVAQLEEHCVRIAGVRGSSPLISTTDPAACREAGERPSGRLDGHRRNGPRRPGGPHLQLFLLGSIVGAGVYGGLTVSRRILFVQAVPAALGLVAVVLANLTEVQGPVAAGS